MAPRTKRTNNTGDQELTQLSQAQLNHFRRQLSSHLSDGQSVSRETGGSCSLKTPTTLEVCVNMQQSNADYIDNIASRISALIDRLRGYAAKGQSCGDGEREDLGVLGNLKEALEDEGVRLGEIQADLAVLEELL